MTASDVAVASDGTVFAAGGGSAEIRSTNFTVVALAADTGKALWTYEAEQGLASSIAIDGAGAVIAVGSTPGRITAVKLAAETGAVIWRRDIADAVGYDADLTAAGDVVVAGYQYAASPEGPIVVKLAGIDGGILWQEEIDPPAAGKATVVRTLAGGDIVALTQFLAANFHDYSPVVVALDGTTGGERWRRTISADTRFVKHYELRATSSGNVVVAGADGDSTLNGRYSAVELSGGDGAPKWAYEESVARPDPEIRLALHPSGDAILGESVGAIVRIDHTTGTVVWRRSALGCPNAYVTGLTVDVAGDVRAVMSSDCVHPPDAGSFWGTRYADLLLTKLAGDDGVERWRRIYGGIEPGVFWISAVALSQKADLVLAGQHSDAVRGTAALVPSRTLQVISMDAEGRLAVCRDGHVDAGEQCDAGEDRDTDCCTASCRLKGPDGTACDDGNVCTVADTCAQGKCQPGGPLPCEPCGVCQPTLGCRTERAVECRTPTASEKSTVRLVDVPRSRDDALVWTWRSGQETAKTDFGDPVHGTPSYALCTYGDDPNVPLAIRTIPDNGTCPSRDSCWSSTKKGWRYRSRTATPDGISSVVLRSGSAGRASIVVHGRGAALRLPGLPLATPVTMVLVKGDGSGACWQATHDLVRTNRTYRYIATNR